MTGRKWLYPDSLLTGSPQEKVLTSRSLYQDSSAPGHYNDKRTRLHDRIIRKAVNGAEPSNKPFALFVAGGPTAGKSTLITALRRAKVIPTKGIVTINKMPFSQLPEFMQEPRMRHPEKMTGLLDEYYDLLSYMVRAAIEKKASIIIEDHCDVPELILPLIKKLRTSGYEVGMIGMTTDVVSYFEHESKRCEKEHREPDHPWALGLHKALADMWEDYIHAFDISLLCRRNSKGPPLSIIAAAQKDPGKAASQHIIDEDAYEEFKKWKEVNLEAQIPNDAFFTKSSDGLGEHYRRRLEKSAGGGDERRESAEERKAEIAAPSSFVSRLRDFSNSKITPSHKS